MTDCTYIMLGQCSVFARGQHYHPCPECYEHVPCELECSVFEENLEDGVYRASHCVCDTCQILFGMVPHVWPAGETQMTSTTTKTFALYSKTTGHSFGEWEAETAEQAMDQMEEQAGQELDRDDIVPQPRVLVKRCDEVEAEWTSADATILIVTHDALDDAIFVPLALLRAMLEAIDAQQGGAS